VDYALFLGCKIPYYLPHYETAVRAVMGSLGVELKDLEFNCCGYPMRHHDFGSAVLAGARNLALADWAGLEIFTPCKCCFGSLKHTVHALETSPELKQMVQAELAQEGLALPAEPQVHHLLTGLRDRIGPAQLKEHVIKPFYGLKVAVLYGCHALRPSEVTGFDDPLNPTIFDSLVELTGAQSLDWPGRLNCCGGPLWEKNEALSLKLAGARLAEAAGAGADFMSVACTYTQFQMERGFKGMEAQKAGTFGGSILYPQLLGLALGLSPESLGLDRNLDREARERLLSFQTPPPEPEPEKKPKAKPKKKEEPEPASLSEETGGPQA